MTHKRAAHPLEPRSRFLDEKGQTSKKKKKKKKKEKEKRQEALGGLFKRRTVHQESHTSLAWS